jgi:hypothetical protein
MLMAATSGSALHHSQGYHDWPTDGKAKTTGGATPDFRGRARGASHGRGGLPRPITPIAIPLRDGLCARDIEDRRAAVAFDADGSASNRKWTWVTRDAGWLVYDPKGKGRITSGLQMFGGVTFWLFWETGYDPLASLDDNGDGVLTGEELRGLAVWHNANGNGVCDHGEVKPLSAYGIVAVSCRFERDRSHPDRIAFAPRGVTFRDGTTRPTFDIVLRPRHGRNRR